MLWSRHRILLRMNTLQSDRFWTVYIQNAENNTGRSHAVRMVLQGLPSSVRSCHLLAAIVPGLPVCLTHRKELPAVPYHLSYPHNTAPDGVPSVFGTDAFTPYIDI